MATTTQTTCSTKTRNLCATALLLLVATVPAAAQAQLINDRDIRLTLSPFPAKCVRLGGTEDGRVVAVWVQEGANRGGGGDELMVAISPDLGRTWGVLFDGSNNNVTHATRITDLSIAVTATRAAWTPRTPWIYIAAEHLRHDIRGNPVARHISCYRVPVNTSWGAPLRPLKKTHVHGQFEHEFQPGNLHVPTRPTVVVAPHGRNPGDYLVVISYLWPDSGNGSIHFSTPFVTHQRISGTQVINNTVEATGGAHPHLAADRDNFNLVLAMERGGGVEVREFRTADFRGGRPAFSTVNVGQDLFDPTVAAEESSVTLLCLSGRPDPRTGARPLERFVKIGAGGYGQQPTLHGEALSRGELANFGSHVFATANCIVDGGTPWVFGFRGRMDTTHTWTSTPLGELSPRDRPGVGAVDRGADAAVFGYANKDIPRMLAPHVHVDPGN